MGNVDLKADTELLEELVYYLRSYVNLLLLSVKASYDRDINLKSDWCTFEVIGSQRIGRF